MTETRARVGGPRRRRRGRGRAAGGGRRRRARAPGRLARSTAFFSFATGALADRRPRARDRSPPPTSASAARCRRSRSPSRSRTWSAACSPTRRSRRRSSRCSPRSSSAATRARRSGSRLDLIFVVTLVLGALTALFILARAGADAAVRARLRTRAVADLTVTLSRILFPILILLGVTRDGRRGPQQLRPLRRLRDLAVLLERGDHRRRSSASPPRSPRATRSTPTRSASSSARGPARDPARGTCATRRTACGGRCGAVQARREALRDVDVRGSCS